MNRRNFLIGLGSIYAVRPSKVEDKPLFVLHPKDHVSMSHYDEIQNQWSNIFDGKPPGALLIVNPGDRLEICQPLLHYREKFGDIEVEVAAHTVADVKELLSLFKE